MKKEAPSYASLIKSLLKGKKVLTVKKLTNR